MNTNFKHVSKEEFFNWVGPRNVHPRPERDRTLWIDLNTHAEVAITTPGYANTYTTEGRKAEETYAIRQA